MTAIPIRYRGAAPAKHAGRDFFLLRTDGVLSMAVSFPPVGAEKEPPVPVIHFIDAAAFETAADPPVAVADLVRDRPLPTDGAAAAQALMAARAKSKWDPTLADCFSECWDRRLAQQRKQAAAGGAASAAAPKGGDKVAAGGGGGGKKRKSADAAEKKPPAPPKKKPSTWEVDDFRARTLAITENTKALLAVAEAVTSWVTAAAASAEKET